MTEDERLRLMADPFDTAPTVDAIAEEIVSGDRSLRRGHEHEATIGVVAFLAGRAGVLEALVAGQPLPDGAETEMVGLVQARLGPDSMPPEDLVERIIKSVRRMVRRPPGE